ncbi:hypothetical protein ACFYSF_20305 [Streptomyces canus]|uniref:hypothetical protein n=1 Tax=Streptomyces canus TaxID=58343 RepID=UPI0036777A38
MNETGSGGFTSVNWTPAEGLLGLVSTCWPGSSPSSPSPPEAVRRTGPGAAMLGG